MAQKIMVNLVDDMDGSEAEETIVFTIDGSDYEIDLSSKNADRLRKAIQPYQDSARKLGRAKGAARGAARSTSRSAARSGARSSAVNNSHREPPAPVTKIRPDTTTVRQWAKSVGITVADRGRIPEDVYRQWEAAH